LTIRTDLFAGCFPFDLPPELSGKPWGLRAAFEPRSWFPGLGDLSESREKVVAQQKRLPSVIEWKPLDMGRFGISPG
jgi:hypothetical protein